MIDGLALVDAHMHVPRLSTVSPAWMQWAATFGRDSGWQEAFGSDGDPVPARLDALLAAEGVDAALLFAEYSPRATGIQPVEDLLPIIAHDPARFHLVANVNPHLHHPPAAEAARQLDLGAVIRSEPGEWHPYITCPSASMTWNSPTGEPAAARSTSSPPSGR